MKKLILALIASSILLTACVVHPGHRGPHRDRDGKGEHSRVDRDRDRDGDGDRNRKDRRPDHSSREGR
jgi:Ni/Co efflux regulator RcnB